MPDITKGRTWVDGETVDHTKLNAFIDSATINAGVIGSTELADDAVTSVKIADDAVTVDKLANTAVTAGAYSTADITVDAQGRITAAASGTIAIAEIEDDAVTTAKILDGSITAAKLGAGVGAAPSGAIMQYGGSSAPTGWLLANGDAVSRTTYSDLFTAISTTYGVGDGSTTFNLPDLRGRVPVGVDGSAGRVASNDAIGESSGSEEHTLTEAELATHSHFTMAAEATTASLVASGNQAARASNTGLGYYEYQAQGTSTESTVGNSSDTGSGSAHNNMQPYLVVEYIIKT